MKLVTVRLIILLFSLMHLFCLHLSRTLLTTLPTMHGLLYVSNVTKFYLYMP
jgi:hypothetical protein